MGCVTFRALLGGFATSAEASGDSYACPDQDYDGICDDKDNCPKDENPYQEDKDYDYIGDVCGNCPEHASYDQTDSDYDGYGDECDNCPKHENYDQKDSDYDGYGDVCDVVYEEPTDSDYDGVYDKHDHCPYTKLPDEVPTYGLGVNRWADIDGDGTFETRKPRGGYRDGYTLKDTKGCSCAQIIDGLYLGYGHEKYGCSKSAIEEWIYYVK